MMNFCVQLQAGSLVVLGKTLLVGQELFQNRFECSDEYLIGWLVLITLRLVENDLWKGVSRSIPMWINRHEDSARKSKPRRSEEIAL